MPAAGLYGTVRFGRSRIRQNVSSNREQTDAKSLPILRRYNYVCLFCVHSRLYAQIKASIETDVNRRRDYVRNVTGGMCSHENCSDSIPPSDQTITIPFRVTAVDKSVSSLPNLMPDYMIVFGVAVLAHDPHFTDRLDAGQLKAIERCVWTMLEPLSNSKDHFSFVFYKSLVDRLKNHKDAVRPDDDNLNKVSWNAHSSMRLC